MENQAKTQEKKEPKETLETQNKELKDTLQRLQADFENYKKRIEKEKLEFMQFATSEFVKLTLPILDNFELALNNEQSPEDFKKGIELIHKQFKEILKNHNVEEIKTKKFSPYLHEAMMVDKNQEKEDNEILETFQKGYKIGEKTIRHAKVKVNKTEEN